MDIEVFKECGQKTYVYIETRDNTKIDGKIQRNEIKRYIEVPFSYYDLKGLTREQQKAICESILLKLNISTAQHIEYFDIDRFFDVNPTACSKSDFYEIKKAIVQKFGENDIELLNDCDKELIHNLSTSYSSIQLANVCGIIGKIDDRHGYWLKKKIDFLEKHNETETTVLLAAKIEYLLLKEYSYSDENIQTLCGICELCKNTHASEELVNHCYELACNLSKKDSKWNKELISFLLDICSTWEESEQPSTYKLKCLLYELENNLLDLLDLLIDKYLKTAITDIDNGNFIYYKILDCVRNHKVQNEDSIIKLLTFIEGCKNSAIYENLKVRSDMRCLYMMIYETWAQDLGEEASIMLKELETIMDEEESEDDDLL